MWPGRRLPQMVAALQYRAPDPDPPWESPTGRIITTGHAEAALAACLANQAGLNLVLSYEAAGPRMFGLLHQALRFTRQRREAGRRPAGWDWRWWPAPIPGKAAAKARPIRTPVLPKVC